MRSPTKPKEVQRLTGCVAALNRFISKAIDKCVPFFDALKGSRRFEWTPQCEEAFQKLKEHLGKPSILSKPNPDEELSLYLSVSQHAVSSVLIREEERVQLPIYYVSKRLLNAESRYIEMERLALALMLYVDGALNDNGSGAGVLLISPEGHKITSVVRFKLKASNNEAEYEALIAGLRLACHLKIERLSIFSDSQLVIGQVKEEYQVHGEKMGAYLRKITRAENTNADALAKLASSKDFDALGVVPIEELERPTIEEINKALIIQTGENWMTPLIQYLMDAQLPNNKDEARRIRYRAARYLLYDGLLYRRGYSTPLQRCLDDDEGQMSLALKVLRQGYYWPTLKKDAFQYARRCDKCQRWGVDLIGPLHLALGGFKFAIVVVDYYTKWAKAKALTTTMEAACTNFMWSNIVCRFGVPHSIVSDNWKQFDNASTRRFYDSLGIQKDFSVLIHPQSNGQVEAVNKILKYTLKKKLNDLKGKWAEELPKVLWAYRMTSRTTMGETPFSMAYGVEAVLPVKIEMPTSKNCHPQRR
ncbi:uncharacterized protein LOC112094323 [Morus notabilis]|uniref:uncharacterized protein LOC112094323 n=1 Tax=Morus notabilis TaxID=981085 RepID=UPI000CED53CD|nr:uncharacterized protein LOC112094323 [Morus notabilis]